MPQENATGRTITERAGLRWPNLLPRTTQSVLRLPPGSRVRTALLRHAARAAFEAWHRGDFALVPYIDDLEIETRITQGGRMPIGLDAVYYGPEGHCRSMQVWNEAWSRGMQRSRISSRKGVIGFSSSPVSAPSGRRVASSSTSGARFATHFAKGESCGWMAPSRPIESGRSMRWQRHEQICHERPGVLPIGGSQGRSGENAVAFRIRTGYARGTWSGRDRLARSADRGRRQVRDWLGRR